MYIHSTEIGGITYDPHTALNMQKGFLILTCLAFLLCMVAGKKKEKDEKYDEKHPKMQEYQQQATARPTKCQVCRILATELGLEINRTQQVKESFWLNNPLDEEDEDRFIKNGMKINYKTSEIRIVEILESVCQNTKDYRSIAGPDFPYIKGVKSMFRQQLEEMVGQKTLMLKLEAPEELIDDPTLEIRRLNVLCQSMIEDYEEDIMDWYQNNQQTDLKDFLCKQTVLKEKDTDCLYASTDIPDFAKAPLPADKDPRKGYNFVKDDL